jgi:hypothetical protein
MTRRVLFLSESREDYLADGLLHGLISLQASEPVEVVDYPRKQVLYAGGHQCPSEPRLAVRGHGFTLYGLLPPRAVDRSYVIQRLEAGAFDLVVVGQVWRQWGQLLDLAPWLQRLPVVLLDGDDDPRLFHRSGTRLRRYGWQRFPIRSGRCLYLKREWQGEAGHDRHCRVRPVGFSIPEEKLRELQPAAKSQTFASHCVDPQVASACGLQERYAFASESAYYNDLALSRFGITTRRGGWDCLRHYEIAAAGSVPCVRQLHTKPATSAPHGLVPGENCLSYQDWPDLQRQITALEGSPEAYVQLLQGARCWVQQHTTVAAARRMLAEVDAL